MTFPPIRLEDLRPETRDWLLAQAAKEHKDPLAVLRDTLDRRASQAGFAPKDDAVSTTTALTITAP